MAKSGFTSLQESDGEMDGKFASCLTALIQGGRHHSHCPVVPIDG